jgi:sulfur carrier protein
VSAVALPPGTILVNGRPRPLDVRGLAELLASLGHEPGRPGIAVAVNGEVVPRADWAGRRLRSGDEVEIVGAVQGG